jgi:hypothetical protein
VNLYCPDLTGGIPIYTEADSFDAVSTAQEIGAGEGDGSAPGWSGIAPDAVEEIEALMEKAKLLNFPGFAELATVQMRLNGQSAETVQEFIDEATAQLDAVQPPVGVLKEDEGDAPATAS